MFNQNQYTIVSKGQELRLPCPLQPGYVYLIHFSEPYKHARHYLGSAGNLQARLAAHRQGNGARLMEVITQAGITWHVSRVWQTDSPEAARLLEQKYKRWHDGVRLCPQCMHRTPDPLASLLQGHYPFHVYSTPGRRRPMTVQVLKDYYRKRACRLEE